MNICNCQWSVVSGLLLLDTDNGLRTTHVSGPLSVVCCSWTPTTDYGPPTTDI
ncbi:hypothetical protein QUF72_17395 [Desulfobacterales bacterium HSG2]|nr:hypothetical protein [Desulfobacterales bacterium HSG2]